MQAMVCIEQTGLCTLAAPNEEPSEIAVDHCVTYPAQWLCTLRQEQLASAAEALRDAVGCSKIRSTGVEGSASGSPVLSLFSDAGLPVDLDSEIWKLRRCKDPDELQMIRKAVACTEAMYLRAREIICPGISELEVFNQLHAAAVMEAGEPITALGNDFQCGSTGGPPRSRSARDGELYILDLGPAYRGYYADNCRTIAVNGQPTDEQLRAWSAIVSVLQMVERTVRPGVSCQDLFQTAKAMLDDCHPNALIHHLGHGFGLFPHEAPHLNPNWDDQFQLGDCFTAEPGIYVPHLQAGIRLEQNYVVTADGVECLTAFPLEM
jgi:Xaa-Pro dipeptidase